MKMKRKWRGENIKTGMVRNHHMVCLNIKRILFREIKGGIMWIMSKIIITFPMR